MGEGESRFRAEELIQDLNINSKKDAEKYEKCETIARLAPKEVLEKIEDPEQKAEIEWIKESHKKGFPSLDEWRNSFVQKLRELTESSGGMGGIKKWHELEAICEELSKEKVEEMNDSERKTVEMIRNIHENSSERRVEIIREINKESGKY